MIRKRDSKNIKKLRIEFGNPKFESFDFDAIESYYRKKDNSSSLQNLSDKTCNDLDFNELFMFIDRTNSKVGQQYLYNHLRNIPNNSKQNKKNEKLLNVFAENEDFRLKVQCILTKLSHKEAYYIASLFQDETLNQPKWYFIVPLLAFTNILSFILLFFNPIYIFVILIISIINTVLHFSNKKNLYNYFSSIPQLSRLNDVAQELFKFEALKAICPELFKSTNLVKKMSNRMSIFNLELRIQNDQQIFFWAIFELVKIVFLIEPLFLFKTLNQIDSKRKEIEELFLFVGEIDTIISIASLRKGLKNYCLPEINDNQKKLKGVDIYHPLIEKCVSNSLSLSKKSILLTGSNMSGKTSFIRTIALNVITGLTINTCFATSFSMPRMRIFSAIRISDDLLNDKSYFFEELLSIKKMINISNDKQSNLFLLDEIFKGTNTVERISAGKAVLSWLNFGNNIVFVSTHDIELADLLKNEYDLYHFSEVVEDNYVNFDYKLKTGKLKSRNAIRILQINNYPDEIINDAIAISEKLDNKRINNENKKQN